jgi:large subunit ribosomal protein L31
MKKNIHPNYVECVITCSCGNVVKTRSTKPKINVEICSACHPFFTGKQKIIDTAGRVEKYKRRYTRRKTISAEPENKPEASKE